VAPPVFKTGLAANIVAGGFDSLPPPPRCVPHGQERAQHRAAKAPRKFFRRRAILNRGAFSFRLAVSVKSGAL